MRRLIQGQKPTASRRGPTDRRAQWQSNGEETHEDRLAAEMRSWFEDAELVLPAEVVGGGGAIAAARSTSVESDPGLDDSFFG